jgi:hypothetical protein
MGFLLAFLTLQQYNHGTLNLFHIRLSSTADRLLNKLKAALSPERLGASPSIRREIRFVSSTLVLEPVNKSVTKSTGGESMKSTSTFRPPWLDQLAAQRPAVSVLPMIVLAD